MIVDQLKKNSHFFAIPLTYTVAQVANLFFREIFRLHGLPNFIVSDRDSKFMSDFWQELFGLCSTDLTPSTSYHLQIDGQIEIVNKWVERYLRKYVTTQQRACVKWLHMGDNCYNTTYHMSIKTTPFMALYGYEAPSFMDMVLGESRVPKEKNFL